MLGKYENLFELYNVSTVLVKRDIDASFLGFDEIKCSRVLRLYKNAWSLIHDCYKTQKIFVKVFDSPFDYQKCMYF